MPLQYYPNSFYFHHGGRSESPLLDVPFSLDSTVYKNDHVMDGMAERTDERLQSSLTRNIVHEIPAH